MAKRLIILFFTVSLGAFTSNCATMPQQKDLGASLEKQAKKYWDIRLNGDVSVIYDMEYKEDLPPFDKYSVDVRRIRKLGVRRHRLKEINVDGKNGTLLVEIHLVLSPVGKTVKHKMTDYWIWDGQWKHILNPKEFLKKTKK